MRGVRGIALRAALVNGAVFVLVPTLWIAWINMRANVVHPYRSTLSSDIGAVPVPFMLLPLSAIVVWRTYVLAARYISGNRRAVWRGVGEAAALPAGYTVLAVLRMMAPVLLERPPILTVAYISLYAAIAALAGSLIGLVLAATGLIVVRLAGSRQPG